MAEMVEVSSTLRDKASRERIRIGQTRHDKVAHPGKPVALRSVQQARPRAKPQALDGGPPDLRRPRIRRIIADARLAPIHLGQETDVLLAVVEECSS